MSEPADGIEVTGMKKRKMLAYHVVAALGLAVPGFALADDAVPQSTTATYDAWQLRCESRTVGEKTTKACEIAQTVQVQGQAQPALQIAIGHPSPAEDLRIVLQLPVGVWLPFPPQLRLTEAGEPIAASFKRCLPAACFADLAYTDQLGKAFTGDADQQAQVVFQAAEDQNIALPISFKGFAAAFAAMQQAAR
jgi:invasion protein IalB